MSYGIMPYMVSIDSIKGLFGVSDEKSKKMLVEKLTPKAIKLEKSFDEPALDVLISFLDGEIKYPHLGYIYWYLIEAMMPYISGNFMDNGNWYPASLDELYKLDSLNCTIDIEDLPYPDDFPSLYFCKKQNLSTLHSEAKKHISDADQQAEFIDWIEACTNNNKDLILFYY